MLTKRKGFKKRTPTTTKRMKGGLTDLSNSNELNNESNIDEKEDKELNNEDNKNVQGIVPIVDDEKVKRNDKTIGNMGKYSIAAASFIPFADVGMNFGSDLFLQAKILQKFVNVFTSNYDRKRCTIKNDCDPESLRNTCRFNMLQRIYTCQSSAGDRFRGFGHNIVEGPYEFVFRRNFAELFDVDDESKKLYTKNKNMFSRPIILTAISVKASEFEKNKKKEKKTHNKVDLVYEGTTYYTFFYKKTRSIYSKFLTDRIVTYTKITDRKTIEYIAMYIKLFNQYNITKSAENDKNKTNLSPMIQSLHLPDFEAENKIKLLFQRKF